MRQLQHAPLLQVHSVHPVLAEPLEENSPLAGIHDPNAATTEVCKELKHTLERGKFPHLLPHPSAFGARAPVEKPDMECERLPRHSHDPELAVLAPHYPHVPIVLLSHAGEQPDVGGELLRARVEHQEVRFVVVVHHPVHAAIGVRGVGHPAQHWHQELAEIGFRKSAPLPRARGEDAEARPEHEVGDEDNLEGEGACAGSTVHGDESGAEVGSFAIEPMRRSVLHEEGAAGQGIADDEVSRDVEAFVEGGREEEETVTGVGEGPVVDVGEATEGELTVARGAASDAPRRREHREEAGLENHADELAADPLRLETTIGDEEADERGRVEAAETAK